jgi:phenylacetate-CoA ligase
MRVSHEDEKAAYQHLRAAHLNAVGASLEDHVGRLEWPRERIERPDESATRTLATGLAGRTFPFIRYDLGDEVTLLPGRCGCGSSMLRVADIAGRRDDDFGYGEHMVLASAFRYVLGTDPLISEYQVRQTADRADVLVVGSPDVSSVAASLVSSLRPYRLSNPEIKVGIVEQIPRHASTGKLKGFIALSG